MFSGFVFIYFVLFAYSPFAFAIPAPLFSYSYPQSGLNDTVTFNCSIESQTESEKKLRVWRLIWEFIQINLKRSMLYSKEFGKF